MINRIITPSSTGSFFLFGARGTGKTTFLKQNYNAESTLYFDLLDPDVEERYSLRPSDFERDLNAKPEKYATVIIDEIQKIPRLLDVVQRLMSQSSRRFILTGSSARKLRRGSANMLAGRAFIYNLFPFTSVELADDFDLDAALYWGTLPAVRGLSSNQDRNEFLRAYALTYLKEEIIAEQLVRKLPPFRRFLEVAAQSNGLIVNFSRIADDVGVDTSTVQSYFSILDDTLVGFMLPGYHQSIRKQQRSNPKFYFFDTGVKRAIERTLNNPLNPGTYEYGRAFEHFVVIELMRLCSYRRNDWEMSYLRTNHGAEIDLVIDRPGKPLALVEIKSSERITDRDVSTLNRFAKDLPDADAFCLSRDQHELSIGKAQCFYWRNGIARLMEG